MDWLIQMRIDESRCVRCGNQANRKLCNVCYIQLKDMNIAPKDYLKNIGVIQ